MGVLFHDLGLLAVDEVVECSASDLIAKYVGQTTPKCRDQLERGIGKVLVINNIHTLANTDSHHHYSYHSEAVDELVSFVEKYMTRMVIVLIGPSSGVNDLLVDRPSLAALFQTEISFANLTAPESLAILDKRLRAGGVACASLVSPGADQRFRKALEILASFPCWTNATDIQHLARHIVLQVESDAWINGHFENDLLCLADDVPMASIRAMFKTKSARSQSPILNPEWKGRSQSPSVPNHPPYFYET